MFILFFSKKQIPIIRKTATQYNLLTTNCYSCGSPGQEVIPIGIMNIKYNQFKKDALDKKQLQIINGKYHDLSVILTPYDEKRVFAVSPLKDKVYTGQVTFKIDSRLFFTNTKEKIASIEMDFDDGAGFVTVFDKKQKENTANANYSSTGEKTIKTKVNYDDGSSMESQSNFTVMSTSSASYDASFPVSGAWNGDTGTGTAYVLYGCGNNNQLRKPIIVSDGFDPPGPKERHFNELYTLLNQQNFIEKMRAEGFDFVILDYTNGADYIQRNAQVLISTINNVNAQLTANGSNAQLIVVGPSMAGLISRYALYYMEQNNMNHNTRLYISFDSPHLGANIPLGDQYWLNFWANEGEAEAAIEGRGQLATAAAQQMLVYHFLSFPNTNSLRTNFVNDTYFKFPTKCRKVAIANGSGNGTGFFNPGDQMVSWRFRHWKVDIDGNTWAVPNGNNETTIMYCMLDKFGPNYVDEEIKVSGTKPYDSAPGGSLDLNKTIADGSTYNKDFGGDLGDITTDHPIHCFIPTESSTATGIGLYYNGYTGLPYYPNVNNSIITPFDAIYVPTSNQEHVTITTENIAWIMNEVGTSDLYLQNQTVTKATDFEARNTIRTGTNLTYGSTTGDFIVQNTSGEVNISAGESITLEPGTELKPTGTGSVNIFIKPFTCQSAHRMAGSSSIQNVYEDVKTMEQVPSELKEEIKSIKSNALLRNYPNPCNDHTHIDYSVKEKANIEISLFNLTGQHIKTIEEASDKQSGHYLKPLLSDKSRKHFFVPT
jgi:triacylglycerol esterase/lipase EstA (alpha/beta hydrolase family)